ncbi:MAG: hypothetical protein E7Z91_06740 [Cyanobacteria bacterium SIG30]|nr:hypothetical protein [Cyanobacteria bacterium SIG30]
MKKSIIASLVALVILTTTGASFAAKSEFMNDLINANKQVVKQAAQKQQAKAQSKVDAKILSYQKQIEAKKAELRKVKANDSYGIAEKAKKMKAINDEIKELNAAIKALK